MNDKTSGLIELVIFSILAGSVGIFVKLVNNLDAFTIVFFRAFIATIFILLLVIIKKQLSQLKLVYSGKTILIGILQGLSIFFYFNSLLKTAISNSVFLLYTAPIFAPILARIFLKENMKKETLIGIMITIFGIIFILDPRTFSFNSSYTIGNIMALCSGFFYAAMAVTSKSLLKKVSGYYVVFWQYLTISVLFLFFMGTKSVPVIIGNWWQLLIIGIICTGIAFILFMNGIKKVKANKVFIITSLEPVAGTILAALILKETITFFTLLGAIIIFTGVYIVTKKQPFIPYHLEQKKYSGKLGILGGMGPEATASLYLKIIKKCQAANFRTRYNSDFPHIVVNSVPVPDGDMWKNFDSDLVYQVLVTECKNLEKLNVDFIVSPSNPVDHFIPFIRKQIKIPILSISETTTQNILEKNLKKVGILALKFTIKNKIYQPHLTEQGVTLITPDIKQQNIIEKIIVNIESGKRDEKDKEQLINIIKDLKKKGAQGIILGCTEIPLVLKQKDSPIYLFDTLDILTESVFKKLTS